MDERQINTKIKNEIKKYETLKKSFLKLYESEGKAKKGRLENFTKFDRMQEDDNPQLKKIYETFKTEMEKLENFRQNHLNKINDLILPVTNCYPNKLKETKEYLKNYEEAKKTKEKLEKSRNEVSNENVGQVQKINAELAKSRTDEKNKEEKVEEGITKFESDKCKDNKNLFLHFIHSELKYHAAALENLTNLFTEINEIDPLENIDDFINKYKIDLDLKELGIDLDAIKSKKEEREKKEKNKESAVYGDDFEESNKNGESRNNILNSGNPASENDNED
jgi:hypothetical protein